MLRKGRELKAPVISTRITKRKERSSAIQYYKTEILTKDVDENRETGFDIIVENQSSES